VSALDPTARTLLFSGAHTAHAFSDEPVTDAQIRELWNLVAPAPTAFNSHPMRIVLVRSPEARARLVSHMSEGNKAKTSAAPLSVVLAWDDAFPATLPRVLPHNPAAANFFVDDEPRRTFAVQQAWLQAGYFIVGVRALGLAAGPMLGFNAAGIDADLLAGTSLRSICIVNVGVPAADSYKPRSPRLDYDEVVTVL
jgi:3-hydroxypropanoate dehydrogenase